MKAYNPTLKDIIVYIGNWFIIQGLGCYGVNAKAEGSRRWWEGLEGALGHLGGGERWNIPLTSLPRVSRYPEQLGEGLRMHGEVGGILNTFVWVMIKGHLGDHGK